MDNRRQFAPRNLSRCSEKSTISYSRTAPTWVVNSSVSSRSKLLRPMVGRTETVSHQCARTACCLAMATSLCIASEPLKCGHIMCNKNYCNCIFKESGRHTLWHSKSACGQNVAIKVNLVDRHVPGHLNVLADTEIRMVNESGNSKQGLQALGKSPCGSVCPQTKHKADSLYVSHSRQDSLEGRLSDPKLEESICLRISSNKSNQALTKQSDVRSARSDSHSPLVAKLALSEWWVDFPWPLPISRSLLKQTFSHQFHTRPVAQFSLNNVHKKGLKHRHFISYSSRNPKSSRMEIISGFTQQKGNFQEYMKTNG